MKLNKIKIALVAGLGVVSLSGCMGQMAVTGMVTKFNLEVVDNRYGREGMFILLSPAYAIASLADLFIFNSIEFWTGKNPITKKSPAVVDIPADAIFKINDDLDPALSTVPLSMNRNIDKATFEQIDQNTLQMTVSYLDGSVKSLRGEKEAGHVTFILNDEVITKVSVEELQHYVDSSGV